MTTFAICITAAIVSMCNLAAVLVWATIRLSKGEKSEPEPEPTIDDLARKWAEIAEDFSPDEFELLRRADRMMAGAEAAVLREMEQARSQRKARPYNWQERGL